MFALAPPLAHNNRPQLACRTISDHARLGPSEIKGQGPGLVNVLCAERKTNKFLTLGARKTTPTIFCITSVRVRVSRVAPGGVTAA